jgi:hypothetical protein
MKTVGCFAMCVVLASCGGSSSNGSSTGGAGGTAASSGSGGGSSGGTGGASSGGSGGGTGGGGTAGTSGSGGGVGGTNTGGSGGSIPLDCQEVCAKEAAANCPNDPPEAQCVAECQDDLSAWTTACPSESNALYQCIKTTGTVVCDNNGESQIEGCDPELVSWGSCAVCVPSPADDACEQCQKASCCNEFQAFFGAANALDYTDCFDACSDQACYDACDAQYPAAAQAFGAVLSCVVGNCPACVN